MTNLIENILNKNLVQAQKQLHERIEQITESKMVEVRKMIAARMDEGTLTEAKQGPISRSGKLRLKPGSPVDNHVVKQAKNAARSKSEMAELKLKAKELAKKEAAEKKAAEEKRTRQNNKAKEMGDRRTQLIGKIKGIKHKASERVKAREVRDAKRKEIADKGAQVAKSAGLTPEEAVGVIKQDPKVLKMIADRKAAASAPRPRPRPIGGSSAEDKKPGKIKQLVTGLLGRKKS